MSNHVYDAFRLWAQRLNPGISAIIAEAPTYLVPKPSASVIKAHARSAPVSLTAVKNALVVDDDGAVVLYALTQESGDVVPEASYRVDRPKGAAEHAAVPVTIRHFHYRMHTRFVVFQDHAGDEEIDCMWAEGACYLGDPIRDAQGWRAMIDVKCALEDVRMSLARQGRIIALAQMCAEGNIPTDTAYQPILVDIGTAIGTAIEQLDHVHRGCSLRQGSRGMIVLTE